MSLEIAEKAISMVLKRTSMFLIFVESLSTARSATPTNGTYIIPESSHIIGIISRYSLGIFLSMNNFFKLLCIPRI